MSFFQTISTFIISLYDRDIKEESSEAEKARASGHSLKQLFEKELQINCLNKSKDFLPGSFFSTGFCSGFSGHLIVKA